MTCDSFKEQLHLILALESPGNLPAELEAHMAECAQCGATMEEMLSIHKELQHIPMVEPSPHIIASIHAIEKEQEVIPMKLGWDIERKLAIPLILVVALMWYAQQLSNYTGIIIQIIIMTCVLSAGFIATLKPYFFSLGGIPNTKFRQ